jgi:hypothetical protein
VSLCHTYHYQDFVKNVVNCKSQNIAQCYLTDITCTRYNIMWTNLSVSFVRWFSPGTPVSSTNKTDRHDMTEILLNVALNTIHLTITLQNVLMLFTYVDVFERKNPEYCTLPEVFAPSLNPGYLRSTYVFCKSWKLCAPAMCVNK